MLFLLLLLPFILRFLGARDVPKNKFEIRHMSCPEVGYAFRRVPAQNSLSPAACYLCFCRDDGTAICWERENRRCDVTSYQHNIGKRDSRIRRSPLGLSDIFFRDATRDVLNINSPETCKPYESSFSDGCPPADWCVGCTVCDCDANGRWDCHNLSFCPDGKNVTRVSKKKPKPNKVKIGKRSSYKKSTKTPPKIKEAKDFKTKPSFRNSWKQPTTKQPVQKHVIRRKRKRLGAKQNNVALNGHTSPKPLIIQNNGKSVIINPKTAVNLSKDDADKLTLEVVKKVMSAMKRLFKNSRIINDQLDENLQQSRKAVKRSMEKIKNEKKRRQGTRRSRLNSKKHSNRKQNLKYVSNESDNRTKNKKKIYLNNRSTRTPAQLARLKRDVTTIRLFTTKDISIKTDLPYSAGNVSYNNTTSNYTDNIISLSDHSNLTNTLPRTITGNDTEVVKNKTNTNECSTMKEQKTFKNNYYNFINKSMEDNLVIMDSVYSGSSSNKKPTIEIFSNPTMRIPMLTLAQNIVNTTDKNEIWKDAMTAKRKNKIYSRMLSSYNYNTSQITPNHKTTIRTESSISEKISYKLKYLQKLLKTYLSDLRQKHRLTQVRPTKKRYGLIRYIKKFFKNLMRGERDLYRRRRDKQNRRILKSICASFGSCDRKKVNNSCLKYKINELNIESQNILKSIRIIKGLLHLLDLPEQFKINKYENKFKVDMHKLSIILRDEYLNYLHRFTTTQINQINYIKNNTQVFIQSIANFARILNDIIKTLTSKNNIEHNCKNHTIYTVKNNNTTNNTTMNCFQKAVDSLFGYRINEKYLLGKLLNIVKFRKTSVNATRPYNKIDSDKNVIIKNEEKVGNATADVELFSKNIVKNLMKLKNLAIALNVKNRRKRSTSRDGVPVEFLLTMMEYLIRQNYHLDTTRVNDGIDLLIDAIKNAPDIKPIKKIFPEIRPRSLNNASLSNQSTSSDQQTVSGEQDSKSDLSDVEYVTDRNSTNEEDYSEQVVFETNTGKNFYEEDFNATTNAVINLDTTFSEALFKDAETTTLLNVNYTRKIKNHEPIFRYFGDSDNVTDDDDYSDALTTTTKSIKEPETVTYAPLVKTTKVVLLDEKSKRSDSDEEDSNDKSSNKIQLDWIDESEEQDKEKKSKSASSSKILENTTPLYTLAAPTPATVKTPSFENNDVSNLSKEASRERGAAKLKTDDVIIQKQKNLLTSLDYITEVPDADDADSKNEGFDSFPSYLS